jgi:hypothetical protein
MPSELVERKSGQDPVETRTKKGGFAMSLVNRGKTWHCRLVANGLRFRQSLATTDWRDAHAKQKALVAQASDGKLTHNSSGSEAQTPSKLLKRIGGPDRDRTDDLFHAILGNIR